MKRHSLRRTTFAIGLASFWQLGSAQVATAPAPSDTSFDLRYSQVQEQPADLPRIGDREHLELVELVELIWAELQHQVFSGSTKPTHIEEVGCRASWTYHNPAVARDDQSFLGRMEPQQGTEE